MYICPSVDRRLRSRLVQRDELLRDALVFGVYSDIVRKKCIAEGNDLTLKQAREIGRTDEATRLQLQEMTNKANTTQFNSLNRAKGNAKTKQRGQRDNKAQKQKKTSNYHPPMQQ